MTSVRRAERHVRDPAWCRTVLEAAPFLVLALNDGGTPYTVPLCVALADGAIYLHMATAGRKLDLIRADARAGFAAVAGAAIVPGATACATGMRADSVAGTAACAVVRDADERLRALDAFALKYTQTRPDGYDEATLAATVVVRLEPITMTGRRT